MNYRVIPLLLLLIVLLSGCLYPKAELSENKIADQEYITLVQGAVDQFQQETGVLPIKNSDQSTPIYEKYPIDYRKLKSHNLLSLIPPNAYENGGSYLYVLIDVETKPKVKLLDLSIMQQVGDIQKRVDDYASSHAGRLPNGDLIAPNFHWLDFDKLGGKHEQIQSVFSKQFLALILHSSGKVAIDYAPDISKAISETDFNSPNPSTDLRGYLAARTNFIPVSSYPYHLINGDPVVVEK